MIKEFSSIKIDFSNNAFQILNGTEGKYSLSEIERCVVFTKTLLNSMHTFFYIYQINLVMLWSLKDLIDKFLKF